MSDDDQMPDLSGLLEQAQSMMSASAAAADALVEGSAGGGLVKVSVDGHYDFKRVTIDPSVVDPADVDMLQDLVLAALRDAVSQVVDNQQGALGGFDLGGLDLGGLLGGGSEE